MTGECKHGTPPGRVCMLCEKEFLAEERAQRIKDGAMRIAAGIEANSDRDYAHADCALHAIALAVLIEDAEIPEKEAPDAS